jgi:hypothetical protein
MIAGMRVIELLDSHLHAMQGGDSRMRACHRIPRLLDVAPNTPAPAACVFMEASTAQELSPTLEVRAMPAALRHFADLRQHEHDSDGAASLPDLSVWPVLVPTAPAHMTTRCTVERSVSGGVSCTSQLAVPAYMAVATPALLKRLLCISSLLNNLAAAFKQAREKAAEVDHSFMLSSPRLSFSQAQHVNFSVRLSVCTSRKRPVWRVCFVIPADPTEFGV